MSSDGYEVCCSLLGVDGNPPGEKTSFEDHRHSLKASSNQTWVPRPGEDRGVVGVECDLGIGCSEYVAGVDGEQQGR